MRSIIFFLVMLIVAVATAQTAPAQSASTLPDSIHAIADKGFIKSGTRRWLLGNHYRKEWITPVRVPVVYIDTLLGGATVTKAGGGKQTHSLRFAIDSVAGREMVIRSIEKFPDGALPPELVGTAASDLLKDQISTAHPYGALIVAPLARAANVYTTHPKIVFIPSSPGLADFDSTYGNKLFLMEERARTNWSATSYFGHSKEIISTEKLLERVYESSLHTVDAKAYLRARLLDVFIGDWDRHEEQWDWAAFPDGEKTVYQPIPKDRDQAFVRLDGILPWIGTRKWLLRRIQHFNYEIKDVKGLVWQARHLDRLFLHSLSWKEWEREAMFLQNAWTADVISDAVKQLPPELYALSGEEIRKKLISRCNNLLKVAREYYATLAKEVAWTGSNDCDKFVVDFKNDSSFLVQQFREKNLIKERLFLMKETKELELYGLQNSDSFIVIGNSTQRLKLRLIGGNGSNSYVDQRDKFSGKKIRIYDSAITVQNKSHTFRSHPHFDPLTHCFQFASYNYNRLSPVVLPGYNPDDGMLIGGGVLWQKSKWGHAGFADEHLFVASYAFRTGAYQFRYENILRKTLGHWDLLVKAAVLQPNNVFNFYGTGNNTFRQPKHPAYYRARVRQLNLQLGVQKNWMQQHSLQFIADVLRSRVENIQGRYVSSANPFVQQNEFDGITWYGLSTTYRFATERFSFFPAKGFFAQTNLQYRHSFTNENNLWTAGSSLRYYHSFGQLVYAARVGAAVLWGRPQFFQYHQLGGLENLRGFGRSRFAGKTILYNNHELRLPLATIKGYLLRGKFGVLAFADNGRVWIPEEHSRTLHWGYGTGAWIIPFGRISFTATYATSREDHFIVVKSGFFF